MTDNDITPAEPLIAGVDPRTLERTNWILGVRRKMLDSASFLNDLAHDVTMSLAPWDDVKAKLDAELDRRAAELRRLWHLLPR